MRPKPRASDAFRYPVTAVRASVLPAPISLPIALLDRARLIWLRSLGPLAGPLMRSRELRVMLMGTGSIGLALLLTAVAPLWMIAVGPILLGVPHVASDVRYLIMRPGLHRRPALWLGIGIPLAVLMWTVDVRWGLAAALGAVLVARARSAPRRLIALVPVGVALALAFQEAFVAAVVIAHLHNFVAVAMWLAWRPRRSWLHAIPVGAVVLGCALILGGALDPIVQQAAGLEGAPGGTDLWYHLATLAPGVADPLGPRLVLLFAFTQSVHYAVWIRLVPEEDRPRETPRTFRASLRAWADDSGWAIVVIAIVLALAVIAYAFVDLGGAREVYLRGVLFHGYLELAIVALLVAEGRGLRASDSPS